VPEGDTVWLVAKHLDDALAGDVLTRSDFRVPALANADLVGRSVLGVAARGKHLLTRVEGGLTVHSHLRMDGAWHLHRPGARWTGGPDHQVRVVLSTTGWDAIGYRLPVLEILETAQESLAVGHLGPDLLDPEFDRDEALRRLGAAPAREIGQALLDQRNLAGVGTMWASESLFLQGINPWADAATLGPDALNGVVARARRLMTANLPHAVQTSTGIRREGENNYVHARSGRPCRRCGTPIRVAQIGPPTRERAMFYCPTCQGGLAPGDDGRPIRPLGAR
jgi:endonuclease-8